MTRFLRPCGLIGEMGFVLFPDIFLTDWDVPWLVFYEECVALAKEDEMEWKQIYRGFSQKRAEGIAAQMKRRGCLSATHKYSDGTYGTYAAYWRLEDEDS